MLNVLIDFSVFAVCVFFWMVPEHYMLPGLTFSYMYFIFKVDCVLVSIRRLLCNFITSHKLNKTANLSL